MPAALYTPLKPSRQEIRILELKKGYIYEKVICNLIVTRVGDVPFEALSYVWGTKREPPGTIQVGGHDIAVTNNLEYALQDLRYTDRNRMLWVDAICINQEDIQERNSQVKRMRLIYERARRAVVWLNSSSDHITAIEETKLLLSTLKDEKVHWFPRHGLQHTMDQALQSVMIDLTDSTWWERIWTVQEAAVAKELVFMHGRLEIPGDWVTKFLFNLCRHISLGCCVIPVYDNIGLSLYALELDISSQPEINETIQFTSYPRPPTTSRKSITRTVENRGYFRRPARGTFLIDMINLEVLRKKRRASFLQLAATCRDRKSTDPRDKVYALLGLAKEFDDFIVDYALPISEVYERSTMELIRQNRNLDVFSQVLIPIPRLLEIEDTITASWVPDWSYEHSSLRLQVLGYRNHFMQLFSAGGTKSAKVDRIAPGRLKIQGFSLDSVKKFGAWLSAGAVMFTPPPALVLKQIVKWRQVASLKYPSKSYIAGGTRQDAFWRSLCFDCRVNAGLPLLVRAGEFDRVIHENWWQWVSDSEHINRDPCDCGWLDCDFDPGATLTGNMRVFHEHILKCVMNRRFAVSRKGYFGLFPCTTKPGDQIFIFPGGKVPLILRPVGSSDGGKDEPDTEFKLVGDAYVHGVMDGQAWDLVDNRTLKLQSIVLV